MGVVMATKTDEKDKPKPFVPDGLWRCMDCGARDKEMHQAGRDLCFECYCLHQD